VKYNAEKESKIILRWKRLGLSNGFNAWSQHTVNAMNNAHNACKIFAGKETTKHVYALEAWHMAAIALRMHRVAALKIFKRLTYRTKATVWIDWRGEVHDLFHKKRCLKKMSTRMRKTVISKAWSSWHAYGKKASYQRNLLCKIGLRIKNLGERTAWALWMDKVKELGHDRFVLEKKALLLRIAMMLKAWASWEEYLKEIIREKTDFEHDRDLEQMAQLSGAYCKRAELSEKIAADCRELLQETRQRADKLILECKETQASFLLLKVFCDKQKEPDEIHERIHTMSEVCLSCLSL
jgi:uncharacterized membrane-anchored protein YhcB (DUF1043 family)